MFDSIKKLFGIPTKAELHEALSTDLNCIFTEDEGPHWKAITQKWWGIDERKAQLLRECQIFISCLRLAATSEKPKTSHQGSVNAKSIWFHGLRGEICLRDQLSSVLQPEQFGPLEKELDTWFAAISWRMPFNEAKGLITKAEKLKTDKARRTRLESASSLLWTAKENGSPIDQLSKALDRLNAMGYTFSRLEASIGYKHNPTGTEPVSP